MNYHLFKRIADITIALVGIIILIPVFIVAAIAVKTTSKGPIIYKHVRMGKNKKKFSIYKFRSMIVGARTQQNKGIKNTKLITTAGKVLRKTFIDETPQLFNVLFGDISLIGPRPLDIETYNQLIKNDKKWDYILEIKPGMTSLESVADYLPKNERLKFEHHFQRLKDNETDFYKHRLILDTYYVNHESFKVDLYVFFSTILLTIKRIFSPK